MLRLKSHPAPGEHRQRRRQAPTGQHAHRVPGSCRHKPVTLHMGKCQEGRDEDKQGQRRLGEGGGPRAQEGQQEPQGGVGGRRLGRVLKGTAKGREHQVRDRLPQTLTGPGPAVLGAQGTMGGSEQQGDAAGAQGRRVRSRGQAARWACSHLNNGQRRAARPGTELTEGSSFCGLRGESKRQGFSGLMLLRQILNKCDCVRNANSAPFGGTAGARGGPNSVPREIAGPSP